MKMKPIEPDSSRLKKFGVFDIEANKWVNPVALGFYDGEAYYSWKEEPISNFLNHILQKKYRSFPIYAHYGGKYDFNFLLQEIEDRGLLDKAKWVDRNGQLLKLQINDGNNHNWEFRDSGALLRFSLDKLSRAFDVKHKKKEFDRENIEEANEEVMEYLRYDCRATYEVLDKFSKYLWEKYKIEPSLTIASTTMKLFRSQFQEKPLPSYDFIDDKIRKAYYGGRCEVFKKKGKDLNYYDINSLYPFVYSTKKMPVGEPERGVFNIFENEGLIKAKVKVKKNTHIPILPYRKESKLIFPVGEFEGWWWSSELKKAVEENQIEDYDIIDGYVFETEKRFEDFGKALYENKKNANDDVEYTITKLLLNSFYGKFAQQREKKEWIVEPDSLEDLFPYNEKIGIYYREKEAKAPYILPAISTAITSKARLELWELMKEARSIGLDVYYCDTDSLVVNGKMPNSLIDSVEIGKLDLEIKNIEKAVFIAPKTYGLKLKEDSVVKSKGIPSRTGIGFEDILETSKGKNVSLDWESVSSWRGAMSEDKFLQLKERERTLTKEDTKRRWEGNHSKPLVL